MSYLFFPFLKQSAQSAPLHPLSHKNRDLKEYQAMPSLRDIAQDDRWLCTFTIQQQLEIPSARSLGSSSQGSRYKTEKIGDTAYPSRTK